jgi:thioredoxin-related protein
MWSINSKIACTFCLVLLLSGSYAQTPNYYCGITTELAKQKVFPTRDKILVLTVSNDDCINCSIIFKNILNDTVLINYFKKENICVLMPDIRPIERSLYLDLAASWATKPPVVFQQDLFDSLTMNLTQSLQGFFVIGKDGKIRKKKDLHAANIAPYLMKEL